MADLALSKLDCSRRQLEVAIRLYFHWGDPVSIHTLASAACNVLRDINRKQGNPLSLKDEMLESWISPEHRKEVINKFNAAANFFKHADMDTDEVFIFNQDASEFELFEAVQLYQRLSNEITPLLHAFRGWFLLKNKKVFSSMPAEMKDKIYGIEYEPSERTRYFQDFLPLLQERGVS